MASRQSPEKCIYCGSTAKITGEHIFGKWLGKYIPAKSDRTAHITSYRVRDFTTGEAVKSLMGKGRLHKTGSPHSHQIKIVCGKCNETWMSLIQNAAKPILLELINGRWPDLSTDQIGAVAAWAAMATTSIEFTDHRTNTSFQEERSKFMRELRPSPDWRVCVGLCETRLDSGAFWHRASAFRVEQEAEIISEQLDTQTTTFPLGQCLIHTLRGPKQAMPPGSQYATDLGLRQFWPLPTGKLTSTPIFTDSGINRVATFYWVSNGFDPTPHFGMLDPEGLPS